jgi:uncharacterized protein (TIGR04222 family)
MDHDHITLWQRICDFQIDGDGVTFTFAQRLARENGWSLTFAERVVDEYKRFIFMAMVAGHEVTPSDEVDEAWHLHLTYTRSYWDGLCRGVLGKPLHHIPTRGGPSERARHVAQYERTLATYEKYFRHGAPPDIWPLAEIRFAKGSQQVRVNRNHVWIVPKPRWPRQLFGGRSLLVGAVVAPLVFGVANPFNLEGPHFLAFYGIVCVVALLAAYVMRQFLRDTWPLTEEPQLSPYEVACLAGGVPGVLRASLATLVADNRLELTPDKKTAKFDAKSNSSSDDHDIDRIMLRIASHENGARSVELLSGARNVARQIETSLQGRGLMESQHSFAAARWAPLTLLAIVFLVGFAKLLVGINRDKPVIFLIVILIAFGVVSLYFLQLPLRTVRGEELLKRLRTKHERLRSVDVNVYHQSNNLQFLPSDVMLAAGLFGLASLHHPDIAALDKSLKPVSDTYSAGSSCGASTGCGGGGGDGGGCGSGCGGCGGGGD